MAQTRKSLIKKADGIFSKHIRSRGSTHGYNHCFTCGAYLPVSELQAGHFIPRRYLNVRWHPVNVWPQCNTCNVDKLGNLKVYERKLIAKFGPLICEALWDVARENNGGLSDNEIQEIVDKYRGDAV